MYLRCTLSALACLSLAAAATAASTADRYHPERLASVHNLRASPNRAETTKDFWFQDARAAIEEKIKQGFTSETKKARNVVMFLGDGMSVPTLAAARTLLGQRDRKPGEEAHLSFEAFPSVGLVKVIENILK